MTILNRLDRYKTLYDSKSRCEEAIITTSKENDDTHCDWAWYNPGPNDWPEGCEVGLVGIFNPPNAYFAKLNLTCSKPSARVTKQGQELISDGKIRATGLTGHTIFSFRLKDANGRYFGDWCLRHVFFNGSPSPVGNAARSQRPLYSDEKESLSNVITISPTGPEISQRLGEM